MSQNMKNENCATMSGRNCPEHKLRLYLWYQIHKQNTNVNKIPMTTKPPKLIAETDTTMAANIKFKQNSCCGKIMLNIGGVIDIKFSKYQLS